MSRIPDMGVYAIENTITGRIYVGSSVHLAQRLSLHEADFRGGYHPSPLVRDDLYQHGAESFRFVILQRTLDALELEYLEDLWARRLSAYGTDGYNQRAPHRVTTETPAEDVVLAFDREFLRLDALGMSDLELARYLTVHEIVRPHGGTSWNTKQLRSVRFSIARRQEKRDKRDKS